MNKYSMLGIKRSTKQNVKSLLKGRGKFALFGKQFEQDRQPIKPIRKKDLYGFPEDDDIIKPVKRFSKQSLLRRTT